jgi:hypothetical protein
MSTKNTLDALEQACKDLKVRLVYDELKGEGGLCRLRDSWHLILNRRLSVESRIRLIREALAQVSAAGPLVRTKERAADVPVSEPGPVSVGEIPEPESEPVSVVSPT